jgi:hypothetical protein
LIKGVGGARTHLVNLENLSDEDHARLEEEFKRLRAKHANSATGENVPASAE